MFCVQQMKEYDLTPEDPTYTALFNACSNSPWPADGLSRANSLRELMAEKDYTPNIMTYNAMIKAYARCGDVKSAFAAADEALAAGHAPSATTYSCLLMACIADKSAGLKLAIEVWFQYETKHLSRDVIYIVDIIGNDMNVAEVSEVNYKLFFEISLWVLLLRWCQIFGPH